MSEKNTKTVSLDELAALEDRSRADAPEGSSLGADFWKTAKVSYPNGPKERLTVRFDRDMVAWFREQGRGYQTRMNAVLRSFYYAHRNQE
jgi:uncharacterized protein (DUF4415 family)